ncbi:MAG: hypothetical protein WC758_03310 [Candidatus Woesearchaeota archaeon]|jgi:hypothetical protein
MVSITLNVSEEFKTQINNLKWVNWSEIAREEIQKKLIFENFLKTGKITIEEKKFCDKIDWHPVDELPLKEEFIRKINEIQKQKPIKIKQTSELFR